MSKSTQAAYDRGFITKIELKDKDGRVKGSQEVITYRGLLNLAHDEGLKSVKTLLIQVPAPENEMTAIVSAEVATEKGMFMAIGDASPDNVNARVRRAIIRMAETRAKARAFRDAVNIGIVSLEELGQDVEESPAPAPTPAPGAEEPAMTEGQRKYIFKLLSDHGMKSDEMGLFLKQLLGVESLKELTRRQASTVIDHLTSENPKDRVAASQTRESTAGNKVG